MATGTSLSNYAENLLLTWMLTAGAATRPTAWYVACFTDATGLSADQPTTEVTGGSYARTAVSFNAGGTANSADVLFPVASANWGTINYIAIFDAATGGNMLLWGALTSSKSINSSDQFKLPAGSITIGAD